MSVNIETHKNNVILLLCFFVGVVILSDTSRGYFRYIGFLPLCHGFIQLLKPNRQLNTAERVVRILYLIRNVVTSYLMYLTGYTMEIFLVRSVADFQLSIFLMIFETLCVFYFLKKRKLVAINLGAKREFSLTNSRKLNCVFGFGALIMVIIYFIVPQTHDVFMPIYEQGAALMLGVTNEDVGGTGALGRLLFTLFTILFGFYRLMIPVYFMVAIKKFVKSSFLGVFLCIILILLQFFFVTERTMSTLINLLVLGIFLLKLYPQQKKSLTLLFGFIGILVLLSFIAMKAHEDNTTSLLSNNQTLSIMLQAYLPGVANMQGVFRMPQWQINYLLSDIYSMIPFRNSLLGLDFGPNTTDLYREYNDAGGQILPLVGQSYFHFGIFAPILSVFLTRIASKYFELSSVAKNYVYYVYYVDLAIFAAMTPCMYYFGIFGSSFLTSIILIYFFAKLI